MAKSYELNNILINYGSKDITNIIIEYCDMDDIYVFIDQYDDIFSKIYETLPPEYKNVHRRIATLFENEEKILFDNYLKDKSCSEQIDYLIAIAKISNKLNIKILFKKCMAIIAMKIKDKQIDQIKKLFL